MTLSRLSPVIAALMLAACGSPDPTGTQPAPKAAASKLPMGYGLSIQAVNEAAPAVVTQFDFQD